LPTIAQQLGAQHKPNREAMVVLWVAVGFVALFIGYLLRMVITVAP